MGFIIKTRNYKNSLGDVVSKETFEEEWRVFQEGLEEEYNKKIRTLVDSIPEELTCEEKLKVVYMWLVDNVLYEHNLHYNADGTVSTDLVKIYNEWGIRVSEKYASMILGRTICAGIVDAVIDICHELGIPASTVSGETRELDNGTRLKHIWNVVTIDDIPKHLDVTYGIFQKEKNEDPLDYFLLSDEELRLIGPHTNFDNIAKSNIQKK